ncbi:MAG: DUF1501 domain-containing protein [Betaproteobacteria bacterium]|nr:DUF1501 domain-containing protein [Betaproteobacteria bacterium]
MNRRDFLNSVGGITVLATLPAGVLAQTQTAGANYAKTLILIELKGGNDGLNTVIPYADAQYAALRPRIAIARDQVLQLDAAAGLHPALAPLMASWQAGELAVVRGVGYPRPNLSHFRSIEIWDTASRSNEFLQEGWLTRAFAQNPVPREFAADAVVVGSPELGPFAGKGTRTISLTNTEQFLQQSRLAVPAQLSHNASLNHILRVEHDIVQAAQGLVSQHSFQTAFPQTGFGNAVRAAAQVAASRSGVAALKVSLNGFDTHSNQLGAHAGLLRILAEGLVALKAALVELGRWDSTLVVTYAEFGRRARENNSSGTDHGTASSHFVLGGQVKGGLYGPAPALDQLDGYGNLPFALDFRDIYATVLESWWGVDSQTPLRGKFAPLDILKT